MDVLGWSMGGDVAIDLAVRHPDVVSSLVSYAGDAGGRKALPPTKEALAVLTDTSGAPQQRGERLIELLFPAAYRAAHPDYAEAFPIPREQASPEAIGLQNRAIGEWAGVWGELKDISCPALFATGTEDLLTPERNAVMMAALVPASWLVRFPGAGHGLMYQDPEGLAQVVLVFLESPR
jgi:pimeloyl-ACP methyl ester carboxylesterase